MDEEIEKMLSKPVFECNLTVSGMDVIDVIILDVEHQASSSASTEYAENESTTAPVPQETSKIYYDIHCPFDIQSILDSDKLSNLSEPIEILRFL